VAAVSTYEFSQLAGSTALTRANDVLAAAWAEAEQVRVAAHAEGFAAGRAEALAQFSTDAAPALAALSGAASALQARGDASVEALAEQAAELALAVAQHVLAGALEVDAGRVVDVCRSALRRLSDRAKVTVRVNPADLELLNAEVAALSAQLGGIERFEIQADRRIDRGGVVVVTDRGEIDATLTTQLARAREIVIASLRSDGDAHGAAGAEVGAGAGAGLAR
jgi:flagellar assembly protein FliH